MFVGCNTPATTVVELRHFKYLYGVYAGMLGHPLTHLIPVVQKSPFVSNSVRNTIRGRRTVTLTFGLRSISVMSLGRGS